MAQCQTRGEVTMTQRVLAERNPDWLHPVDHPPPRGTKLLLLSPYGVAQTGDWYDEAAAWMPLPKVDQALQDRLRAEGRLR